MSVDLKSNREINWRGISMIYVYFNCLISFGELKHTLPTGEVRLESQRCLCLSVFWQVGGSGDAVGPECVFEYCVWNVCRTVRVCLQVLRRSFLGQSREGCGCVGENSCTVGPEHNRVIFGMMLGNRWEGELRGGLSLKTHVRTHLLAPGGGAKNHIHCEFWTSSQHFQEFLTSRHTLLTLLFLLSSAGPALFPS